MGIKQCASKQPVGQHENKREIKIDFENMKEHIKTYWVQKNQVLEEVNGYIIKGERSQK